MPVPCDSLYAQPFEIQPPLAPKHWSYSGLTIWRDCPRRWWLENSRHGTDEHRYPKRIHPAAVEGILVHRLLDRFAKFLRERQANGEYDYDAGRRAFGVRRELLTELDSLCSEELAHNPRIDLQQIRARVDVDACLNAFRRAVPVLRTEFNSSATPSNENSARSEGTVGPPRAVEKWLEAESPRIGGQVDLISRSVLTDYKTGSPNDHHWDQLRFYALLYWLTYSRTLSALRLVYTATGDAFERVAPTVSELLQASEALISEIRDIDGILSASARPPARPTPERCRACYVRQLCNDYWNAAIADTLELKAGPNGVEPKIWWGDVEVRFSERVTLGSEYSGPATTTTWGAVWVRIGPGKLTPGAEVTGARLLGARCEQQHAAVEISAMRDTEVFWLS